MEYTKQSPKCSSNNVIPIGLIGAIKVNRYICRTCRFCEGGIDTKHLNALCKKPFELYIIEKADCQS